MHAETSTDRPVRGATRGIAATVLLLAFFSKAIAAQELACDEYFAGRRISFVVPYQAGGGYDAYARAFAPVLEQHTGLRVRVRNLAGAGGTLGIQAIAEAHPDLLVLGIVNPIALIDSQQFGLRLPSRDSLLMLGSFIFDTAIGVGRKDTELLSASDSVRVVGVVDTEQVRTLLAIRALGWNARVVRGYSGSSERWLALLRRDIDAAFGTTESLENYLRGEQEVQPFVSLTDAPNKTFPAIPYLAGTGGLVDFLTRELASAERTERMNLAQLAAELSIKPRAVAVTSKLAGPARECLETAVEEVLFSQELAGVLQQRGLGLDPVSSEGTHAAVERVAGVMNNSKALIDEITLSQGAR